MKKEKYLTIEGKYFSSFYVLVVIVELLLEERLNNLNGSLPLKSHNLYNNKTMRLQAMQFLG